MHTSHAQQLQTLLQERATLEAILVIRNAVTPAVGLNLLTGCTVDGRKGADILNRAIDHLKRTVPANTTMGTVRMEKHRLHAKPSGQPDLSILPIHRLLAVPGLRRLDTTPQTWVDAAHRTASLKGTAPTPTAGVQVTRLEPATAQPRKLTRQEQRTNALLGTQF
jgi:hypothetical protein